MTPLTPPTRKASQPPAVSQLVAHEPPGASRWLQDQIRGLDFSNRTAHDDLGRTTERTEAIENFGEEGAHAGADMAA
jgi:hypothetical protein